MSDRRPVGLVRREYAKDNWNAADEDEDQAQAERSVLVAGVTAKRAALEELRGEIPAPDGALRPIPYLNNWAKGWATGIARARSEGR